jgi:MFS family permease
MSHHGTRAPDPGDQRVSGSGLPATRSTRHYVLVLVLLVLLVELTGLTYTMVTPALTGIASAFHSPDIAWIMTAVTLVGAVSYAVFGKAGDILGKRKIAVAVTGVFAAGSVLSAVAPSIGVMIAGRALQGAGICALALVYGLIRDLFPRRLVPVALGFIGAGFGVSPIIGPLVGGVLIDSTGFRGVFWFLAVYSVVIGTLVWTVVPETPLRHRVRMDWVGVLLLSAGAVTLMLGVGNAGTAGWAAPPTLLGVIGGVALLVLWVVYERHPAEPLIDTGLLRQRRVSATLVASFVVQFALGGSAMLLPMFVMAPTASGYGFGVSALGAAAYVVAGGVAGAVAGPLAGFAGRRVGPRATLSVGIVALTAGSLLLALLHPSSVAVMVDQFVMGIGIGACSASLPNMIVRSVPAEVQGISGGMMTLVGSIGSAFSTQLMGVFLLIPATQELAGQVVYGEWGFTLGFLVIGGLGLVGVLAMALAGSRREGAATADRVPAESGVA